MVGAAAAAVGAMVLVMVRSDDEPCRFAARDFDGSVLPGGPQDPDVAFQQFLDTAPDDHNLPSDDPSDWIGTGHETAVNWEHDGVWVHMARQPNGWAVTSIEHNCG